MCNQAELSFMSSFTVPIILDPLPILACTFCSTDIALLLHDACLWLIVTCLYLCQGLTLGQYLVVLLAAFAVDSHTNRERTITQLQPSCICYTVACKRSILATALDNVCKPVFQYPQYMALSQECSPTYITVTTVIGK